MNLGYDLDSMMLPQMSRTDRKLGSFSAERLLDSRKVSISISRWIPRYLAKLRPMPNPERGNESEPNQWNKAFEAVVPCERKDRKVEILLAEYKAAQDMTTYYGRVNWDIGAVFAGAAAVGVAALVSSAPDMARLLTRWPVVTLVFSLSGIVAFTYLYMSRNTNLQAICRTRLYVIEKELGMWQHVSQLRVYGWKKGEKNPDSKSLCERQAWIIEGIASPDAVEFSYKRIAFGISEFELRVALWTSFLATFLSVLALSFG